MNRPEHYWLKIDSIIHSIYNVDSLILAQNVYPDLKAPANSDVTDEDFSFGESTDEEQALVNNALAKDKITAEEITKKEFDKSLVKLNPFNTEILTVFPHKAKDGEVPLKLLVEPKVEYITNIQKQLELQQKEPAG